MTAIRTQGLTRDFGDGKGVFNLTLEIDKGEVYGFIGPNGAGKTTVIRLLMGFIKSDSGRAEILGMDCWSQPKRVHGMVGYLAGELAYPVGMTGLAYLRHMAAMRGTSDMSRSMQLLDRLELNAAGPIQTMSKGMKQKLAIVSAFQQSPEILILDEPTSGLDPLMQSAFIELIHSEKERGATIFMSSHLFDEVELTCDRIAILRKGKLADIVKAQDIHPIEVKSFAVQFHQKEDYQAFLREGFKLSSMTPELTQATVNIEDKDINALLQSLAKKNVKKLVEIKVKLADRFMDYYEGEY